MRVCGRQMLWMFDVCDRVIRRESWTYRNYVLLKRVHESRVNVCLCVILGGCLLITRTTGTRFMTHLPCEGAIRVYSSGCRFKCIMIYHWVTPMLIMMDVLGSQTQFDLFYLHLYAVDMYNQAFPNTGSKYVAVKSHCCVPYLCACVMFSHAWEPSFNSPPSQCVWWSFFPSSL